jgi:hypothetical protein
VDLREGLRRTLEFYREHMAQYVGDADASPAIVQVPRQELR